MKPSNAYPGMYSDELKAALGMTEGAPPPWLINMQRYGPPPSYSSLKIPGLNAPIPEGSEFGYHPGGWGKPPVDHAGNPLYGDVFGVQPQIEDDLDTEVGTFTLSMLCTQYSCDDATVTSRLLQQRCRVCLCACSVTQKG